MATKFTRKREIGFGSKDYRNRVVNNDGSVNVERSGLGPLHNIDVFYYLIHVSWLRFFNIIIAGYLAANTVFALMYMYIGVEHVHGIDKNGSLNDFVNCFFFSAQTLTTVGYGHVYPVGFSASSLAAFESMMGLLLFALATGLLYGRFARPVTRMLYSTHAIVAPYQNITAFMFRVANMKKSELIEAEAKIMLAYNDPETGKREFDSLALELDKINFLSLTWTVVHPIDEQSPIYNWTPEDFQKNEAEFIILLKAFDDTFSQHVYSRKSYIASEMKFGYKFVPMTYSKSARNAIKLDLKQVHEIVQTS